MAPASPWNRAGAGLALLLVVLAPAACGDDGAGPEVGTPAAGFEYTVGGDIERDVSGDEASHALVDDPDIGLGTIWRMTLRGGAGNENGAIQFLYRSPEPPTEGTYALSGAEVPDHIPAGEMGAFVVIDPLQPADRFLGAVTAGQIVFDEIAGIAVQGSFAMQHSGNLFPPGGAGESAAISIDGTFTALEGQ